jgi:hypothetical protein
MDTTAVFLPMIEPRIGMKRITLLTCLSLAVSAPCVPAAERYYVLIFSAQCSHVNSARLSHSWGTFVRVADCGPDGASHHIESVTISWLPRNLEMQPLDFPKKGVNLSLHDTLRWSKHNGLRVSLWGPYEIEPSLYIEAVNKATQLASGTVLYQMVDFGHPIDKVANCIRALTDVPMGSPPLRIGVLHGDEASHQLALNLLPWILDPGHTHDWVIGGLGLNRLGLVRRYLEECP